MAYGRMRSVAIRELTFTFMIGPRGAGKNFLGELLKDLIGHKSIGFVESSAILDWHTKRETSIGHKLLGLKNERDSGGILPGELVYDANMFWLSEAIKSRPEIRHLIIAGAGRTCTETEAWKAGFSKNILAVHITATEMEIWAGIYERQIRTGIVRKDEAPLAVNKALREYREKVVPAFQKFNGQGLEVSRSEPLMERLPKICTQMVIPTKHKRIVLDRLSDRHNILAQNIRKIDEQPKPPIFWLDRNCKFPNLRGMRTPTHF